MSTQEPTAQPEKEQEKPAVTEKPARAEKPAAGQLKPKAEQQTNCPVCNKPIKRLTRYYRDGKFYCGRKCWRTVKEKAKKEKEPA